MKAKQIILPGPAAKRAARPLANARPLAKPVRWQTPARWPSS